MMAELGLAIVGTIDLCFRWGNKVIELCNDYRHANEDVTSRCVRFEANWFRTQKQLDFLRQISGEMDEYHRHINHRTIEQLHIQLKVVWDKLSSVSELPEQDNGIFRHFRRKALRWKFVLIKEGLDLAIEELDKWHATADPSWYLLLRISNNKIDQVLTIQVNDAVPVFPTAVKIREARNYNGDSGVFLPPKDLENMAPSDIPLSIAKLAQRRSSSRGVQNLILTALECPPGANVDKIAKEVRELARKLAVDDPKTFGLLCCKGVVKTGGTDGRPAAFTMVFRSPQNCANVSSLRSELLANSNSITLGDKFAFARQLAKSISYIHTLGFVHKSVRPENILVFRESSGSTAPSAYLAGFDSFRKEDGRTYRKGIYEWEKNIYQHPSRQGLSPREDYVIQHDIYSLGVCLLEIGLWDSFTICDTSGKNPIPSPLLNPFALDCQAGRVNVTGSKDYLLRLCREQLARHMGPKYGAVVETCLTCLDPDNDDFGDEQEFMDRDGILVGVRYIEKVLSRLNEISL